MRPLVTLDKVKKMLRFFETKFEKSYLRILLFQKDAHIFWFHLRIWVVLFRVFVHAGFDKCVFVYNEIYQDVSSGENDRAKPLENKGENELK